MDFLRVVSRSLHLIHASLPPPHRRLLPSAMRRRVRRREEEWRGEEECRFTCSRSRRERKDSRGLHSPLLLAHHPSPPHTPPHHTQHMNYLSFPFVLSCTQCSAERHNIYIDTLLTFQTIHHRVYQCSGVLDLELGAGKISMKRAQGETADP